MPLLSNSTFSSSRNTSRNADMQNKVITAIFFFETAKFWDQTKYPLAEKGPGPGCGPRRTGQRRPLC